MATRTSHLRNARWRRTAGIAGVFGGVTTLAGFPPGVAVDVGDGSGIDEPPLHWFSHASAVPVLASLALMLIGVMVLRGDRIGGMARGLVVISIGAMAVTALGDALITWAATVQDVRDGGLYYLGHDLQSISSALGTLAMVLFAISTLKTRVLPPLATWFLLATLPAAVLIAPALTAIGADPAEAFDMVFAGMGVTWAWWGVDLLRTPTACEPPPNPLSQHAERTDSLHAVPSTRGDG
jgi:hypothetical protein